MTGVTLKHFRSANVFSLTRPPSRLKFAHEGLRRHPLRVIARLGRLAGAILVSLLDYLFRCAFRRPEARLAARALWLHRDLTARTLHLFQI